MNKKTNKSSLIVFREMLKTSSRKELIDYYDKYILEEEKQKINDLKKMIYTLMKRYENTDIDKNRAYFILYQNLKKGFVNYDDTLKKFMEIN